MARKDLSVRTLPPVDLADVLYATTSVSGSRAEPPGFITNRVAQELERERETHRKVREANDYDTAAKGEGRRLHDALPVPPNAAVQRRHAELYALALYR